MLSSWRLKNIRQCGNITVMSNRYRGTNRHRYDDNNNHNNNNDNNRRQENYDNESTQWSRYSNEVEWRNNDRNLYSNQQQYAQPYQYNENWQMNQSYSQPPYPYWNGGWYGTSYPTMNGYADNATASSHSGSYRRGDDYNRQQGRQYDGQTAYTHNDRNWGGGYQRRDFHSNSYQPRRYEGNYRHESNSLSGRSSRQQSDGEDSHHHHRSKRDSPSRNIPKSARKHYIIQTVKEPEIYPVDKQTPKPLPLLVLDLNGTLVYRGTRSSGTTAERSQNPILRPYLSSFLQYCLAVDAESASDVSVRQEEWKKWQTAKETTPFEDDDGDKNMKDSKINKKTHGTHFWTKKEKEPEPFKSATFRLLLWSSAQPQNVDHMARAILEPGQAEQLLRVYARDTLVRRKFYSLKSPSIKDLEILWTALNNFGTENRRAEERLFADARNAEDKGLMENEEELYQLCLLWEDRIVLPKLDPKTNTYSDGEGYGPHNTLLLDDSTTKARLQPFNHLLVPEFDGERADAFKAFLEKEESEREDIIQEPEDVLLQVVGVLEHARHQANVSSWIRFGGLGDFGGVRDQHPFSKAMSGRLSEENEIGDRWEVVKNHWDSYFSEIAVDSPPEEQAAPFLNIRLQDRTPTFWANEGKAALYRRGIKPIL